MVSEDQVYRDLRKFLDTVPAGGYTATESGSDIRLLKRLFTLEEARVAMFLTRKPEPIKTVYNRVKKGGMSISIEELKRILDSMLRKGLLRPYYEGYDETYYSCTDTTAGGLISVQVDRLSPELIHDIVSWKSEVDEGNPPPPREHSALRVVPVQKSVPQSDKFLVGNYDDVRKLVEAAPGPFAVGNCICRQITRVMGGKCAVTDLEESCLMIGPDQARRYVNMGIGRFISREEVFDILAKAQKDGLVLQPENSQQPEAICCCCGDCCVYLTKWKHHPRPADLCLSNYYAEVDPELCNGCGTCTERCQLEARVIVDGVATVNLDRCVGCGHCVAICPSGASQLRKKEEKLVPVKDKEVFYLNLFSSRQGGKQG